MDKIKHLQVGDEVEVVYRVKKYTTVIDGIRRSEIDSKNVYYLVMPWEGHDRVWLNSNRVELVKRVG